MSKYWLLLIVGLPLYSVAKIWTVGPSTIPGFDFQFVRDAAAAVQDGDTVDIDGRGVYRGDVCGWTRNNLLIRGVNGRPHLEANGAHFGGKGIWVFSGNNIRVENIEFSGAVVPDNNGAGIRLEPNISTVIVNCYFHNNENGILTANGGKLLVEHSEFGHNGYGDGYSHNIYVGRIDTAIIQYSYFHHAKVGHEFKSRARVNFLLYNRFSNEAVGDASRNIDLPNGGQGFVIGNIIQQSPVSANGNMLGYGLEGLDAPANGLYVINNTFVNNRSGGSFVHATTNTGIVKMYNNIFSGAGTVLNYDGSTSRIDSVANIVRTDIASMGFEDPTNYDYRITNGLGVDVGSDPGMAGTFSLRPLFEYVHPAGSRARLVNESIDIGAYETAGVLPLKTIQLTVTPKENEMVVQWYTQEESGIGWFELQRGIDGSTFETLTTVQAKNQQHNQYTFTDIAPNTGKIYYRVRVVEADGQSYFSNAVVTRSNRRHLTPGVKFLGKTLMVTNIPESFKGHANLQIINYAGQVLFRQSITVSATTITIPASITEQTGIVVLNKANQQLSIPFFASN